MITHFHCYIHLELLVKINLCYVLEGSLLVNGISFVALFDVFPSLPLAAFGANLSLCKVFGDMSPLFYLLLFFVLIHQFDLCTTYNCIPSIAAPHVSLLYPLWVWICQYHSFLAVLPVADSQCTDRSAKEVNMEFTTDLL